MMNEEQYIAMMREDMKENFTMSFRNRPSQISVPRRCSTTLNTRNCQQVQNVCIF